ncbi:MAG: FTR1 family iron permease [Thermoplasmata archaeon]
MIASFLIALREGIEAALIVAIILSYLKKVDAQRLAIPVYYGAALGILGSIAVGGLFMALAVEFEGASEQLFEGSTMLLAAAILTSMILWMHRNSKAYSDDLKLKVQAALGRKESYGLAMLAFISILREGIETVLFLGSASFSGTGVQTLLGGSLGLAAAILLGLAIMRYSVRLNLRTFFSATGTLLILFAAGLVAHGLGEYAEAGLVPAMVEQVWDSSWIVRGDSQFGGLLNALFGYTPEPSLVQILGYVGYWLLVALWIYRDSTFSLFKRALAAIRPAA